MIKREKSGLLISNVLVALVVCFVIFLSCNKTNLMATNSSDIHYSVINKVINFQTGGAVPLDLNNDGTADIYFHFYHSSKTTGCGTHLIKNPCPRCGPPGEVPDSI